mgnify:CR=1 FL=1
MGCVLGYNKKESYVKPKSGKVEGIAVGCFGLLLAAFLEKLTNNPL